MRTVGRHTEPGVDDDERKDTAFLVLFVRPFTTLALPRADCPRCRFLLPSLIRLLLLTIMRAVGK